MKKQTIAESLLNEVNMSPSRLKQLVEDIPGAKAGMEFEMLVPNVIMAERKEDVPSEPDYDMDEDTKDIDTICDFFDNGDQNSSRDIDALRVTLTTAFKKWLAKETDNDKLDHEWREEGEEYLRDWLMDEEGLSERDAINAAEELWWKKRDWRYEKALNQFIQDKLDRAESEWLKAEGYEKMKDIEDNFSITWPYWTEGESGGDDDEMYVNDLADDFSNMIGKNVDWSLKYHGADRTDDGYALEPDGSLKGMRGYEGLEFISHPMPIPEMISDLKKIVRWAGRMGCETNQSTGLHMNVSMPRQHYDKFDYVKMVLFLGDNHLAEQFGRYGNEYCESAMDKIKRNVKRQFVIEEAMDAISHQLQLVASRLIHKNTTNKFTSINIKNDAKYVEVRSPGGDWLNADIGLLVNTLNRIVVALDAACDAGRYRKEYMTKLYKLLAPNGDSMIDLFVRYSTGVISADMLKGQIKSHGEYLPKMSHKHGNVEVDGNGDKRFFDDEGQLHRDNGPAIIYADGGHEWYQHGKLHRVGGPAVTDRDGTQTWWENGVYVRQK